MEYHVFISYAREDHEYAAGLEKALTQHGLKCWRDHRICWGADFPAEIERALASSQALLVVGSHHAALSDWVQKEIDLAIRHSIPILPLVYQDLVPYRLRSKIEWLNHLAVLGKPLKTSTCKIVRELKKAGVGSLRTPFDERIDENVLIAALPSLDSTDLDRLRILATETQAQFGGTPRDGLWTVHGLRHTNGLIETLGRIVADDTRGNRHACFCLAAAACLHDTGLVRREVKVSSDVTEMAVTAIDRRHHHEISARSAYRLTGTAQLSGPEAELIADLCYYHNWSTNVQERAREPEKTRLMSLFRMANALDLGPVRAPSLVWDYNRDSIARRDHLWAQYGQDTEGDGCDSAKDAGPSVGFWLRNLLVSKVEVERDRRRVVICCRVPCDGLAFVPRLVHRNLERDIERLAPFIGSWDTEVETHIGGLTLVRCQSKTSLSSALWRAPTNWPLC